MIATASANNTKVLIFCWLSIAVLCVAASMASAEIGHVVCMQRCKQIALGLYRGVQDESLPQVQKCDPEGYTFRVFWWSSLFLTGGSRSDEY